MSAINESRNTMILREKAADIPVYQEQLGEPVWGVLGGGRDHILVLDRCGRMAYQVIAPYSKLTYPYVKAAILSTYRDDPCGVCNKTKADNEEMTALQSEHIVDNTTVYQNSATNSIRNEKHKLPLITTRTNKTKTPTGEDEDNGNRSISETLMAEKPKQKNLTEEYLHGIKHPTTVDNDEPHVLPPMEHAKRRSHNEVNHHSSCGAPESTSCLTVTTPKPVTLAPLVESEDGKLPFKIILHEPHVHLENGKNVTQEYIVLQTGNPQYHGHLPSETSNQNWDWSKNNEETQVNSSNLQGEDLKQSVEVVPRDRQRKKKKKGNKKKNSTENTETLRNTLQPDPIAFSASEHEFPYNSAVEDSVGDSSSGESEGQTQRLFNGYQQRLQSGTQNEEEDEQSNVLKEKVIEHYRKLYPWIKYKLTPKSRC